MRKATGLYHLELHEETGSRYTVPIAPLPFRIGRSPENDLVLLDPSISRQHATIEVDDDTLVVTDHSSRNHVFVNNEQIQKRDLHEGDVLTVGAVHMRVMESPIAEAAARSDSLQTLFFRRGEKPDAAQAFSNLVEKDRPGSEQRFRWAELLTIFSRPDGPECYREVLKFVAKGVPFDRGFLIAFGGSAKKREVVAQLEPARRGSAGGEVLLSSTLLQRVYTTRESALVTKRLEPNLNDSFIASGAHTAICLPLEGDEGVVGALYLDSCRLGNSLGEDDIKALAPLCGVLALKMESIRLHQQKIEARLKQRDLETAQLVQESLESNDHVEAANHSALGYLATYYEVGGDFFDLHESDDKLTLFVGDVSGKGLSAALYSVSALSTLRAHLEHRLPVTDVLDGLQRHVNGCFRPTFFITFFIAQLSSSGALTYVNAGHPPPIIVARDGSVRDLPVLGPAVNMVPGFPYEAQSLELADGDLVVAFTDGVHEREGAGGEQFGRERLTDVVREHRNAPLSGVKDAILDALEEFATSSGACDDVTLLVARHHPDSKPSP